MGQAGNYSVTLAAAAAGGGGRHAWNTWRRLWSSGGRMKEGQFSRVRDDVQYAARQQGAAAV